VNLAHVPLRRRAVPFSVSFKIYDETIAMEELDLR